MVPQDGDEYLTMGGETVAWPLDVPTSFGEWMLVSVVYPAKPRLHPVAMWVPKVVVVPLRALMPDEVILIKRRPILFWGMKVPGQPWARVMCRPSAFQSTVSPDTFCQSDPLHAIGV